MKRNPDSPIAPGLEDAVQRCGDCHRACTVIAATCLHDSSAHAHAPHIRLLLDTAQLAQTAADFMLRGSDAHAEVCALCATLCERCAASCDGFGDDSQMRSCAQVCRRCAEACRRASGATGKHD